MKDSIPNYSLPQLGNSSLFGFYEGIKINKNSTVVCGWAFDANNPEQPLDIYVVSGERLVGSGKAVIDRPDVQEAGAPVRNLGFTINLKLNGDEKVIKVIVKNDSHAYVLSEQKIIDALPKQLLQREDVIAAFNVLFHREPENEDIIQHQLSVHSTKESLYSALFASPEFFEKNTALISILHNNIFC